MRPEHVAAVLDTIRELADQDGARRKRIVSAALEVHDVRANAPLAHDLLESELAGLARDLVAEVARLEGKGALNDDAEGMLALDLALVRVLERVDAEEAAEARRIRTTEASDLALRSKLWADPDKPVGLVRLAGVVWTRTVAARWKRGVERPAALVRAIAEPLNRLARGAVLDETRMELVDARGERIAGRNPSADVATLDREVMRRGLDAFRSTMARRMIRFLAHEAHRGEARGDHRPEIVNVEGGLVGLAEVLDAHPRKDAQRVRALLDVGRWVDVSAPGLEVHGLWTWVALAEAPGRRARLEVELNRRAFLSGGAEAMRARGNDTRDGRRDRLLVPVLRHDPPYRVGQRREWGRVWSVADAVLVRLVDEARELVNEGGVRLEGRAWKRLVTDAGLDDDRARAVRDLLLGGDGVAPSMLRNVGGDRFTLADAHAPELAFILSRFDSGPRKP